MARRKRGGHRSGRKGAVVSEMENPFKGGGMKRRKGRKRSR